jgi:hypothetical protein
MFGKRRLTDPLCNRITVVCLQISIGKPRPHCRAIGISAGDQDKSETFGKTGGAISEIEYLITTPFVVDIRGFKKSWLTRSGRQAFWRL